jgi:hypothetical protein
MWRDRPSDKAAFLSFGSLKKEIVQITSGRKIAYVVDCSFTDANTEKIVRLAKHFLFIKATLLEADATLATARHDLTARQARTIARQLWCKFMTVYSLIIKHASGISASTLFGKRAPAYARKFPITSITLPTLSPNLMLVLGPSSGPERLMQPIVLPYSPAGWIKTALRAPLGSTPSAGRGCPPFFLNPVVAYFAVRWVKSAYTPASIRL